jgi:hypothetical protein
VVDWSITFWSAAAKQGFTINPGNGHIGLFAGVTANPSGLVAGTDLGDVVNLISNQVCNPSLFFCYFLEFDPIGPHLTYGVSGFGLTDTVEQDHIPVPFATRLPRAKPPVSFRILRHIVTIGLETTPTLLQKVEAAQRFYEANDASDTCAQLTQLVSEAQAMGVAGAAPQSTITQIVGYANSIRMQIACAGCGS